MLWPFLAGFESPAGVTPVHVRAWAHGIGLSGREPSSATVGARIACLSSFYRFLIRMQAASSNPCDALKRPKDVQSVARGLGADEVRRLLAVVPDTVAVRRDRALLLTFVLTGRRRSEVIGLTAGDLSIEGETAFYSYRGKGGKEREEATRKLNLTRDVVAWQATMTRLDAAESLARQPLEGPETDAARDRGLPALVACPVGGRGAGRASGNHERDLRPDRCPGLPTARIRAHRGCHRARPGLGAAERVGTQAQSWWVWSGREG
jgi:integrase